MKHINLNWHNIESQTHEIIRQITRDQWMPDYVVGLTRGGLHVANLLSQYFNIPMETLKVSLRDGVECETNCWMAEDAANGKKILIVDDINDTGATLNWIKSDWELSCPNSNWGDVWGDNVKVAVLVDNESSESKIDIGYAAHQVNKAAENCWIVFPWENWWNK